MGDFKRLKVWNAAHELTLDLYRRTLTFPAAERYGLTSQVRRAAASIPVNLAEGCGRRGDREMRRFVRIARGSAHELECLLLLTKDLGLLTEAEWCSYADRIRQIGAMLTGLLRMPPLATRDSRLSATPPNSQTTAPAPATRRSSA